MKYFSEKSLEKKIEAIGGGGKTYSAGAGLDLNDTVFSIKDSVLAEIAKISDWFELKDGNIHVKKNRGFWSDSFISAGGLSSGGGAAAGNATLSNVTATGATISADSVGSIDVYSKGYLDTALAQAGKVQSVVGQTGAVTAAQIGSALISEGYELTDHTYTNGTGLSLAGGEFSVSTEYQAKIQSGEDAYTDLHNWFERKNVGTEANPVWAIHVKSDMGFYGDSFISAGGISPGGGASAGNATLVAQTYGGTLSATGIDPINFYSKEKVDQLLATAGTVQTVAGVSPTSGDIPVASLKSALGLGAAAAYGIGSVASGSTGLVTGGSVYSAINEAVSSVMKMQGTTTTPLSDGSTTNPVVIDGLSYTAKKGDVVLYDGKEYLWAGSAWEQLGDEASWALKTTSISAGTGLEGGGTLASNRTISINPTYQTYISNGNTAYGWGDWRTRVGTLETNLTALTTRVTTLEGRTNWDTYFGVDENGDIFVKKNGDTARNFYSWGAVSAGGLSSGGGSGGIDPAAMWSLLGDSTNEQIAASHLATALNGYATQDWVMGRGYITGINSSMITTALGYTPVAPSALADYVTLATSQRITGDKIFDSANLSVPSGSLYISNYGNDTIDQWINFYDASGKNAQIGIRRAIDTYGPTYHYKYGSIEYYYKFWHEGNFTPSDYLTTVSAASTYAKLRTYNDLTFASDEFTFAQAAHSGALWFNARTASGLFDGAITYYRMGNGAASYAGVMASGYYLASNADNSYVLTAGGGSAAISGLTVATATNCVLKAGDTMSGTLSTNGSFVVNSHALDAIDPTAQHIVINGYNDSSSLGYCPGIGFHIPGITYGTLKLNRSGEFAFLNATLTGCMPIRASAFIKDGGTSSQFLKADGSVDSTSYLPLTGGVIDNSSVSTSDVPLRVYSGDTSGSYIHLRSKNNEISGYIGMSVSNGLTYVTNVGQAFSIWHSSNSNLSTVPWSCSTLTATTATVGSVEIGHTNEINALAGSSDSENLYLNFRSNGLVSIAYGGGNVGIGTTAPAYKLDVNGIMRSTYLMCYHGGQSENAGYIGCGSSAKVVQVVANSGYNIALNGGNVGIGTNSPSYTLDVNGSIGCSTLTASSSVTASGGFTSNAGKFLQVYKPGNGTYNKAVFTITSNHVEFDFPNATDEYSGTHFPVYFGWRDGYYPLQLLSSGVVNINAGNHTGAVIGTITFKGGNEIACFSGDRKIWLNYDSTGDISMCNGGGNVGIGKMSPSYKLDVSGDIVASGAITAGSASDARLKTNIQTLSAEAAKRIVMALNPVTFTWNSTATELYDQYKGNDLGFIAQEVEPYLPQAIGTIFEKYMRLDQTKVIAPLVKVAQDHETRIRQLERENAELKRRLNMN